MRLFLTAVLLISSLLPLTAQSSWQYLPQSPSNGGSRIDDVYFINDHEGWCATSFAEIHHTKDGGLTWEKQYSGAVNEYFRCIEFRDSLFGMAGTLNNKFLRTVDGGLTWTNIAPQIVPVPNAVCGVDIADSTTVYAVGEWDSPAHFLKSTDKGITWIRKNMAQYADALVDINFTSRDTGFVSGKKSAGGVILYTTDGGDTWTQLVNTAKPGEYIWKLQQVTPQCWVAAIQSGYTGRMLKSTDGGMTWNFINTPLTETQGIGFSTPEHGWIGGYINGFYETTDGGSTWTFRLFGGNFNRFFFINPDLAFASGNAIFKFTADSVPVVDIPQVKYIDPFDFTISPTPANGSATISFDLLRGDIVRITLVAMDGTEQKVLFCGRLDSGQHDILVNTSDLPEGQWVARVQRNVGLHARLFTVLHAQK